MNPTAEAIGVGIFSGSLRGVRVDVDGNYVHCPRPGRRKGEDA
jgi:hypothetical protein